LIVAVVAAILVVAVNAGAEQDGGVKVNFLPARFAITVALILLLAVVLETVDVVAGVTLKKLVLSLSPTEAVTVFEEVKVLLYTISITLVVSYNLTIIDTFPPPVAPVPPMLVLCQLTDKTLLGADPVVVYLIVPVFKLLSSQNGAISGLSVAELLRELVAPPQLAEIVDVVFPSFMKPLVVIAKCV